MTHRPAEEQLRALLREKQGLWCDDPIHGQPYPDYACGKCWTCRVRAVLAGSGVDSQPTAKSSKPMNTSTDLVIPETNHCQEFRASVCGDKSDLVYMAQGVRDICIDASTVVALRDWLNRAFPAETSPTLVWKCCDVWYGPARDACPICKTLRRALKTEHDETASSVTSDKCEHGIPRRFCTAVHGSES